MNQKIIQFPKTDLCSSLSAIGEENNKYVAAVTAIENTMVTLSQMSMPPKTDFANEPKTYDQIADCYKKIQNLAVEFTTKIYSELEHYPNACITSLERIDASLKKAQEKVDFIMSNPKLSEDDLSYEANLLARYMDAIAEEADGQIADLNILIDNALTRRFWPATDLLLDYRPKSSNTALTRANSILSSGVSLYKFLELYFCLILVPNIWIF